MSEVCVSLLLILTEKKRKIPNLVCDFIPQLKGGREVHVVRPRVSVENELADWKTTKNEKLALRFSHNHTCKNYADIRLQHPAKMSFFCTNESSVMLRRKWKKNQNKKK